MLALQLAKRGLAPLLIERGSAGRGIAYGTADPAHLLNVPAGKMSAWPDRPDDFAEWAGVERDAFAQRRAYGDYLSAKLAAAEAVTVAEAQAVAARRAKGAWRVTLDDGREVAARNLALATGNGRPARFAIPGLDDDRMVQDPWGPEAEARLAQAARSDAPVLLVGTGLTMVDVVLTLDRLGHRGPVTAVSRRGLVPRAHAPGVTPTPAPDVADVPGELSAATRWLRERAGAEGWRSAVDSLRPVSQQLWARWPGEVKARFVRHARPWWDVHRHRIAPQVARLLAQEIADGRLTIMAGRVGEAKGDVVRVRPRPSRRRFAAPQDERGIAVPAALAVNCTGPSERLEASGNPLLRQMLADGLIAPGPLGLGIACGEDGEVLRHAPARGAAAAQDERDGGLWALGPLAKGEFWEISAVPDIRVQAERVARRIAQDRERCQQR
jgi:uncharacterized NAD(P)/FAD-binding protein YdhS